MDEQVNKKIFQPAELYRMLGIKNTEEAEKVLSTAYSLLNYLNTGDAISTSGMTFTKLSSDLIYLETHVSKKVTTDELIKKKVIRLPV